MAIARAMMPTAQSLLALLDDVYTSIDFKTGIDMGALENNSELMMRLIELDPRGAILGQQHVASGLRQAYVGCGLLERFQAACLPKGMRPDEIMEVLAYKIRCMGSHIREKYDAHKPGIVIPTWLATMFELMRKGDKLRITRKLVAKSDCGSDHAHSSTTELRKTGVWPRRVRTPQNRRP